MLFIPGNAGECATITRIAPVADFNKHPTVPVTHNQVKFTVAKVNIAGDPYQACLLQIVSGIFFMPGTNLTAI